MVMSNNDLNIISATQAAELLNQDPQAVFIDVRSHMEYLFIGHPTGAVNIPWIDEPDWVVNPDFVRELRQLLLGGLRHGDGNGHSVAVLLICRSGKRSVEAGNLLLNEGFENVYSIADGFEGELDDHHHRSSLGGWRFEGLPWEQC
jgi:rhodanese-related sulfurtransferase